MQPTAIGLSFPNAMLHLSIDTGPDEFSFAMGPAKWTASGTLQSDGAGHVAGVGLVTATGLDALIGSASGDPQMSGVVSRLDLLKRIGRQDGDKTTWKLVHSGDQTFMNGLAVVRLIWPR